MTRRSAFLASACAIGIALSAAPASPQGGGMGQGQMMDHGMGMGMGQGMGMGMRMGPGGMSMGMGGGCPMMGGMMMGGMAGMMAAHAEGRVAFLKAELGITQAQQAAWDAYAAALKKNLANMQSMHQTMMAAKPAATPVERLDQHIAHMEGRISALKEVKAPLAALYEALSDEQKKKADALLTGMGCMM